MYEFKLPDLGEGVVEGQIVSVLVKEGEAIAEYQPMLEVETDKAAVEIPSPKGGVVAKLHCEAGQVVKVGDVLVTIDEGGGKAAPPAAESAAAPVAAEPARGEAAPADQPGDDGPEAAPAAPAPARDRSGPIPAAPVVRKLARELGVELASVTPTGPNGRVLREDVERAAQGAEAAPVGMDVPTAAAAATVVDTPIGDLPDFSQHGPIRREPAPQIRKTIARQMAVSWQNIPRVTHIDTADITDLDAARKDYNGRLGEDQPRLSVTAVIVKALGAGLKHHPKFNSTYDAAAGETIYKDYINVAVAVDTPRGLVVPVLRDVDTKPLPKIAAELVDIVARTRAGKFEIAELRGATFTLTNIGPLGGKYFTPMVNYPETAILGLGRASWEATVREGEIVPRFVLPLSLSFDHRGADGAEAARFCSDVIRALENPLHLIGML